MMIQITEYFCTYIVDGRSQIPYSTTLCASAAPGSEPQRKIYKARKCVASHRTVVFSTFSFMTATNWLFQIDVNLVIGPPAGYIK